jgi:putative ABC transport system permease protein
MRFHKSFLAPSAALALGIGMSVAMFSLVDAVLLRPLPFPRQNSIEVIWKADPLAGPQVEELAYPELRDLQENIFDFESIAMMPTTLYGYGRVLERSSQEPVQIESAPVSHDFFKVLGVTPAIGRDFSSSDEHPGAAPVVILSDRVWREQLHADPSIVGQLVRLNGEAHSVIGVMGPGVEFPLGVGLWIPLGIDPKITERRGATYLQAIARVRPGANMESIAPQVNALFQRVAREYPRFYSQTQHAVVTPLPQYWTGSARLHLWIMLTASMLLLAAAAISAGSLLLSRTLARTSEFATRLALGAGRRRILSQLGLEGATVSLISTVAGLAIAEAAIRFLIRWATADIPRLETASIDFATFGFAAAIGMIAAVASSVTPGWTAIQTRIESALREGSGKLSMSRRASRARGMFLSAQAAVTVTLLVVSALLLLSYRSMMTTDVGLRNRDTLTMNLALKRAGSDSEDRRSFYKTLLDSLRQSPGVISAASVLVRPLEGNIGWDSSYELDFEEGQKKPETLPKANYEPITPSYFATVGTPILEGRDFDEHDGENREKVIIVTRALAQRFRDRGRNPIGSRVRLALGGWMKVVGVVADARYRNVTQTGIDIFVPYTQAGQQTNYVVIRGSQPASELASLVRQKLAALDPSQAIASVSTIGELIDANAARHRFNTILLAWFGACASILAALGVYGVVRESIALRKHEIAIKSALGAQKRNLVRDLATGTLAFVLIGEALGLVAIVSFGSLAAPLLYQVSPRDPEILGLVAVCLLALALISAVLPAWRTASNDPARSLRA